MIENSENNKVHIVILTWNNNKILKRCLESIENVDYKKIVVKPTEFHGFCFPNGFPKRSKIYPRSSQDGFFLIYVFNFVVGMILD